MINRQPTIAIFMDEGKGRAGNRHDAADPRRDSLYKLRFPAAELASERDDASLAEIACEFAAELFGFARII